ncbi:transcriptional regulator, LytTR family [Sulfitobacter marinus]|uniref:Transcriptional regulator, LytTR family n=1 Tax=Sulfitobacter marinus TaxID=394264 RepID=A0A1I6UE15_9RHOB|nr:LytTR family DNA-binding domain-containing protein [Sulfitobacter marinus]SFS99729.1 transcriptional regulator, LytTR family [Sulfitobacter marinus]
MSSTHRERKGRLVWLAFWSLATVLCAIAGPFGTHAALLLGPRLIYWACVIALSVLGTALVLRAAKDAPVWKTAMLWGGYITMLSVLIHTLNSWLFEPWQGTCQLLYLWVIIAVTVLVVHGAVGLARYAFLAPPKTSAQDPETAFLRHLPLEKRAPLIRIEAQDHYLNVVTQKGSALVLLRLQDAVAALHAAEGLQVHRSHWVAKKAVAQHRRVQGRDYLVLVSGDEIPVSRSFRPAVIEAGLI